MLDIKRSVWTAATLLGWSLMTLPAQAASFDCARAGNKVEHMICDDQKLSDLDSNLGQVYQNVLSKANDEQRQQVIAEQKHWLKFTRNVCEKETCLKHAYWSRQAALETYFEPRSPLYEKEPGKAEAIRQVLATAPLYPLSPNPFCRQVFEDLKQMKGIRFVDPVVQAQSYEDPALDPWKKQCRTSPPFNFSYSCERNIEPSDADDVTDACHVGYGLPPFRLYELPPDSASGEKRYFFYADEAYGPMNRDWKKPKLGGAGLAGFQQIHIARCLSTMGNQWERGGKELTSWRGGWADADQGSLNGKNYNSIIEYRERYYFLILHERSYGGYGLDILPTTSSIHPTFCNWRPVKP